MALRVASAQELAVILNFQAHTGEAEESTRKLGEAVNEMTADQLRQAVAEQSQLVSGAKELEKQTADIQRNWWRTQRVLRASAFIFRSITIAGTAMWAPIIAGAVSYAKQIEKIDGYTEATAEAWLAQTRQLENAKLRIGRVSAQVLQPYLEDVTKLANKAAGFIETHPGLIEAALKTGVAVTTVGVLGSLVTAGIKMVVDVKFVAASAVMELASIRMENAANKMLTAATGQNVSVTKRVSQGLSPALTAGLGRAGLVIGSVGVLTGIAKEFDALYESARKLGPVGKIIEIPIRLLEEVTARVPGLGVIKPIRQFLNLLDLIPNVVDAAADSTKKGAAAVVDMTRDMERLEREGEGARIILELQRDLAASAQKYAEDRANAIEDSDQKIVSIQQRYSDRIVDAWQKMNERIEDITRNYNKQSARAEEDYLLQRHDVVQSAHKKAQDEEAKFQEKLRQLRLDHEERVDELVRARDALGLVKEERRYQREVDEATRAHTLAMQREKKETRDRLKEIDQRYKLERRRRYEDYIQRVQEEHERYLEARKEAAKQRDEELKENREALKEKLADLREAYEQEKREAVNAAYEKIVLLRGAYDAELRLRQQYHGLILQSTEQFLEQMLQTFDIKSGQLLDKRPVPEKQTGGFIAGTGIYKLHAGEYVMNPSVTRAAEHALGGRLNDRRLMSALGGGTTINLAFPGGLITRHELASTLKQNRAELLQMLERELA